MSTEGPGLSRGLIVVFRLLLLTLALGAVAAAIAVSRSASSPDDPGPRYACPMHPEVRSGTPSPCPICGMALEPVGRGAAATPPGMAERMGMADLTAVENIKKHKIIDFVRMRALLVDVRELRGPAWIEDDGQLSAIFYTDQIAALPAGETGWLTLAQTPQTPLAVRRTAAPAVVWDQSTSRIQFRMDGRIDRRDGAAPPAPRPGQVGWIEVARKVRDVLTVPATAVLQSPEGPYVLAARDGNRFQKQPIEIGETFLKQGFAVVLSGLRVRDRVVSRATFFVDADRRLDTAGAQADGLTP
jgi:hypothetical protein